ncbi:MAG TPA: ABC transporter ATP-binding protein [Gemmatimonadaceae bacterium]|nr:ABC transporter ATP-binding protein [Gemmatimonadaceae bacterium]
MILFDDVVLRYPRAPEPAVRGVTLDVSRGTLTAIVGPNGSGKSTLVRALLGRLVPERGRIVLDGVPLETLARRDVARRVAIVPQREEPVFPLLVRDFIALGRFAFGGVWSSETADDRVAVERAAERAGAAPYLARRTDELSGGEWQRVRIARALSQSGDALVLDEPTAFLDIGHEMGVFELLDTLAREGRAVLLVSHQLNLVARFATRIVLLHRGALAAIGAPEDVMRGDQLERVYEWPIVISRDPAVGAPVLVPLRGRAPR